MTKKQANWVIALLSVATAALLIIAYLAVHEARVNHCLGAGNPTSALTCLDEL